MKRIFNSKFFLIVVIIISIAASLFGSGLFTDANAKEKITITEFSIPNTNGAVAGITDGPDGNLWFTKRLGGYIISRITPSGIFTEFGDPSTAGSVDIPNITTGPDGNLWFTLSGDKIGRITPSGTITDFPIPSHDPNDSPNNITTGPDGNIWYTREPNWIGRITPTGTVTEFPVPTSQSAPWSITAGPDGNLWFTENYYVNNIGRITPDGIITEFPIPTKDSFPQSITAGPDGNLWFTENATNQIGRITPSGKITEFSTPTSNSAPYDVTAGPDGNIWFTESDVNKIGRVNLSDQNGPDRDFELLSLFNNGVTWTVSSGYFNNQNQSSTGCHIGLGPDHCRNQLFGLDMVSDQQDDTAILAPGNGKVAFRGKLPEENCIGLRITLDNGLNMNVCHFASYNVSQGDRILRGKVLGTRSTPHVHLSLDDRYRIGTLCPGQDRCFLPIPFDGQHTIEGMSLDPDPNGETVALPYPLCDQRNISCQFKVDFQQYKDLQGVSSNIAMP